MTASPTTATASSDADAAPATTGRRRPSAWLDRLGPGPTRGTWDASWLDGVRAIAVLLVVVLHVWADSGASRVRVLGVDLTWIPASMSFGVVIFFVLSGYLLARPWFVAERTGAARPRARAFWRRRLLRIVPAYYLSIAVVLILFVPARLISHEAVTGRIGAANIGGQMLFLQGYLPITSGNLNNIDGAWWTLTVEMTLYALLPFMVPLFLGRRLFLALPLAFVGTVVWVYLGIERLGWLVHTMMDSLSDSTASLLKVDRTEAGMRTLLYHAFPTWLVVFGVGIALARLSVAHEFRLRDAAAPVWWQRWPASLVAVVTGSALVLWTEYHMGSATPSPFEQITHGYEVHVTGAMGLGLLLGGLTVCGPRLRKPLSWTWLRFIGWTSYGIYLFHLPAIAFLMTYTDVPRLDAQPRFFVLLGLDLLLAIAAGTASWLLVERPLLRRKPKRTTSVDGLESAPVRRPRHWPQFALVASAAAVAGVVVLSSTPSPSVSQITGGLFARGIVPAQLDEGLSGRATLSLAASRNLMYPMENTLLAACAPGEGTTAMVVTEEWSAGASAFPCARRAAAAEVLRGLSSWETTTAGFRPVAAPIGGVAVYFRDQTPPTPTHPDQFHVRFTSGRWVVGFNIQARSVEAGQQAVAELHAALTKRLRRPPA